MRSLCVVVLLAGCIADDAELEEEVAELGDCPVPPSNLYARAIASWNLKLTWADRSTNEDGFYIERSDNGGAWFIAYEIPADRESTTDGFYASGSSFRYRIRAFNDQCVTTPSAVATVPRSPTGLAGQYVGGGKLKLTWADRSNNETYFMVQRRVGTAGWQDHTDAPRDVPTATVWLAPGTNRFRVRAASDTGSSWYTNEVSYTN